MAINLSQAFHRTSANAIDETLTLTKAEMLAINDHLMPSKYLTVCQDDGKIYLYDKSNTADPTTGKFRVFEGGGGGTSDYDDLTNKPTVNNVTLEGDLTTSDLGITIPENTSDLTNDSGFITNTDLATALEDYVESSDLATVATTGAYSDLTGAPTVPEELSDLSDVDVTTPTDGQILKYDGTSQKWINGTGGGGGGDAELESDITSNVAVGAITSGTTLLQGTTFTEFVRKLLVAEVAPTINFSISKSGAVPSGSSYTETLTVACTNMGGATKIKTIAWYEGETLKQTDTINSTTPGSWTYTMPTATTQTTTFKSVVTYTKSDSTDASVTKTATITFASNKYYGAVTTATPTEAQVKALTSEPASSRGGVYQFTCDDTHPCYAYPKSFGLLTGITDPNGFSLMNSFAHVEMTFTIDGSSVDYYVYTMINDTVVDDYPVTFA